MHNTSTTTNNGRETDGHRRATSTLATLRGLLPPRPLRLGEALRIAELQANRLRQLTGSSTEAGIHATAITDQPRIIVEYDLDMPVSGSSDWDTGRRCWVITLNAAEPQVRQRFSLFHEYKHILDHNGPGLVVPAERRYFGLPADEYVADYFAACVLMPRMLIKRAWGDGIQRLADLAELFDVSTRAMEVRLDQLGLRGQQPVLLTTLRPYVRASRTSYHRQRSANWRPQPVLAPQEVSP